MQKIQSNLKGMLMISIAVFIVGQAAGAINTPSVSSGEIPNLTQFGEHSQVVDANGVLNLQGPIHGIVSLSGYYSNMNNYLNIFYAQAENRGFTTSTSGGESGGNSGGDGGSDGGGGMMM
jgi:uncharacterized membrane protein YgcG